VSTFVARFLYVRIIGLISEAFESNFSLFPLRNQYSENDEKEMALKLDAGFEVKFPGIYRSSKSRETVIESPFPRQDDG